ncbi:hypothetical protein J2S43_004860 [Catenuloplanes nepalensis]|uniref:PASTA domain-containing protein n=1 Tax=Catenuloplanes nepalensis TaxID=587533 RepID=A0ABT9MY51_9ACTN|nr:PASTA domain-containing protein [Catenuloplanes nepalensis]MDP9796348.1 hypothetical protein [Catenuloplanes nepalensis]
MAEPKTPEDVTARSAETAVIPAVPEQQDGGGPPAEEAERAAAEETEPAATEEGRPARRVRLRDRIVERLEAQIPLPGGLTVTGLGKLALVVILVFVAVGGTVLVTRWEPKAKVPALVGVSREEAERRLADANLAVGGIEFEESDEPPGTVLRTDPRIGTKAAHDSGVTLVLARPFGAVVVPPAVVPSTMTFGAPPGTGDSTVVVPAVPGLPGLPGAPGVQGVPGVQGAPAPPNPGRTVPVPAGTSGPTPAPAVTLGAVQALLDPALDGCDTGYRVIFRQAVSLPGPGTLTYRWLRSDGVQSADQTVQASPKGATVLETTWAVDAGESFYGWQLLDVTAPAAARGAQIAFERSCEVPGGEGAG